MVKAGTSRVFCAIFFLKTSAGNYIELLYVDFALLNWKFHGLLIPLLPLSTPCTRCMSAYSTFVNAETSGLRIERLWWYQLTALALNLMKTAACLTRLWFWINQWFIRLFFSPDYLLEHITGILPFLYLYLLYLAEMLVFFLYLALKFKYPSGSTTSQHFQED
jgi:hypothetical protein